MIWISVINDVYYHRGCIMHSCLPGRAEHIGPKIISPDVAVASDALIVLMSYQDDGYALMSF